MKSPETRHIVLPSAEVRALGEPGKSPLKIAGKAMVYGSLSECLCNSRGDEWREFFRAGAFTKALSEGADVRFLVNHDPSRILGRNTAGTLRLTDGPEALEYEVDVPETATGTEAWTAAKRRDLTGISFRFYCTQDDWRIVNDVATREVIEADIDDISLVAFPAYPDTTAAVRSLEHFRLGQPGRAARRNRAGRLLRLAEAD